ncbi:MAG: hypothetical protein ACYDH5_16410 [Acidimicrobiales bacterium]
MNPARGMCKAEADERGRGPGRRGRILAVALPDRPLPYWGWGDIPDQYRRRHEVLVRAVK